jgi:histidine triad (HIT) family protein
VVILTKKRDLCWKRFLKEIFMADTIFGKIARGEIPVDIVYQDDMCLAFPDINPQAPIHLLVIPREPFEDATQADESTFGHLMAVAAKLGKENCPNGFRLVLNIGNEGGMEVPHLHVHILGGRQMTWPPG